jgi:RNA polymerase sigma-70 factor (ECF subfamily)
MPDEGHNPEPAAAHDTTAILLDQARGGDQAALERLLSRYRAPLSRWASGRLPGHARDVLDTEDLVQEALIQSVRHVGRFERRWKGAFHSYLRQVILNKIRDQVRRARIRERVYEQAGAPPGSVTSPLEDAIGAEALERYEKALERLGEDDREIIVARMEMDCTYEELAELTGKPSPDAARMAVKRALMRLADEMEVEPPEGGAARRAG